MYEYGDQIMKKVLLKQMPTQPATLLLQIKSFRG